MKIKFVSFMLVLVSAFVFTGCIGAYEHTKNVVPGPFGNSTHERTSILNPLGSFATDNRLPAQPGVFVSNGGQQQLPPNAPRAPRQPTLYWSPTPMVDQYSY